MINAHPARNMTFEQGYSRRNFLRKAGLMAALSPAAAMLFGVTEKASAYTPPLPKGTALDIAILNFALNLEYLEGEYYTRGSTGYSLAEFGIPLTNNNSTIIKRSPLVPFNSAILEQYALEIASDEQNHIRFLQETISSLGGTPVSMPVIDLANPFNAISSNANLGPVFDPFADEVSFFLGGYSLTDVGVTAYNGSATLLTNPAVLQGASSILAVEAYHASTLRLTIFDAGPDSRLKASQISKLRDYVDDNGVVDMDQGVVRADGSANIVPTDANSLAFARDPRAVLNIVYTAFGAPYGGFFPNGTNGVIT